MKPHRTEKLKEIDYILLHQIMPVAIRAGDFSFLLQASQLCVREPANKTASQLTLNPHLWWHVLERAKPFGIAMVHVGLQRSKHELAILIAEPEHHCGGRNRVTLWSTGYRSSQFGNTSVSDFPPDHLLVHWKERGHKIADPAKSIHASFKALVALRPNDILRNRLNVFRETAARLGVTL